MQAKIIQYGSLALALATSLSAGLYAQVGNLPTAWQQGVYTGLSVLGVLVTVAGLVLTTLKQQQVDVVANATDAKIAERVSVQVAALEQRQAAVEQRQAVVESQRTPVA